MKHHRNNIRRTVSPSLEEVEAWIKEHEERLIDMIDRHDKEISYHKRFISDKNNLYKSIPVSILEKIKQYDVNEDPCNIKYAKQELRKLYLLRHKLKYSE